MLKLPGCAFVFRMPDRAASADHPSNPIRHERHSKQIFFRRTRDGCPRHAPVNRMKDRALVSNHPTGFLTGESDRVERRRRSGRPDGPILTAGACVKNSPAFTDGPTTRVVDEKDVGEIVAPAFGEPVPRQASVVSAHHESISAGSPTERFVREVEGCELWTSSHIHWQPDVAPVARGQYDAAISCGPAVQIVSK